MLHDTWIPISFAPWRSWGTRTSHARTKERDDPLERRAEEIRPVASGMHLTCAVNAPDCTRIRRRFVAGAAYTYARPTCVCTAREIRIYDARACVCVWDTNSRIARAASTADTAARCCATKSEARFARQRRTRGPVPFQRRSGTTMAARFSTEATGVRLTSDECHATQQRTKELPRTDTTGMYSGLAGASRSPSFFLSCDAPCLHFFRIIQNSESAREGGGGFED